MSFCIFDTGGVATDPFTERFFFHLFFVFSNTTIFSHRFAMETLHVVLLTIFTGIISACAGRLCCLMYTHRTQSDGAYTRCACVCPCWRRRTKRTKPPDVLRDLPQTRMISEAMRHAAEV